jgi:hypothetical protein
VRLNWKTLRLALAATLMSLAGISCSGINASQSVSPATFLLPGIMKNDVPAPVPTLTPTVTSEIASVN